jgi:uncharacterized protein YpmB
MTGPEIMAVVIFFLTVSGIGWGIWWKIAAQIKDGDHAASAKADAAAALATLAQVNLAEHKLHVAETYVSKAGHRESTEQVMEAIQSVKVAIDGTNLRIDRMWESNGAARRRTTGGP